MVQNIESVRADLEAHPFSQTNALRQRHVQLREQWAIDSAAGQSSKLAWTIVEEDLSRKRRLAKRRRSTTIGVNHRRIDVVDDAILLEDTNQVTNLAVREIRDRCLVC